MNTILRFKGLLMVLLCTTLCYSGFAQLEDINLGIVLEDELKLKECSFDKNADAVILLDKAASYFNDEYNLITERRIRLKILKEKGVERGNVSIPYYSNNGFEVITGIEAVVVSPEENGNLKVSALEKKNIYNRKVNSLYSEVKFALPNVKVGSVIDYRYKSTMKNYVGLKKWDFQSDIPILVSSYTVAPIPNSEFNYSVYKKTYFPIKIDMDKSAGRVRFEMNNIPGIRDEVYSTSPANFFQRVNFQLSGYTDYYGKHSYTTTWEQLTKELLQQKEFGTQVNKDLSGSDIIKRLPSSLSALEKMKALFNFVRSEMVWNDIYSKYSDEGVKTTLEKKKGNTADINLLLVSLLKSAGVEAYPLLVSERRNGIIDTTYSYLDQFDKVIAYVNIDGTPYVLDGTDKYTPFFMVSPDLLNTIGFLVDKKKRGFVYFSNLPHKDVDLVSFYNSISESGVMSGEASVRNEQYAKLYKEERYRLDTVKYREALLKSYPFLNVDSFSIAGVGNDSAALVQTLKYSSTLKKSGGYYLVNYNLFTGFNENPFITQQRFTDIDFGARYLASVAGTFTYPPSWVPEQLPANKTLVSPDRTMSVSRAMQKDGNTINVLLSVKINKESYSAEEYDMVKAFFSQMTDLFNEPILFKAK